MRRDVEIADAGAIGQRDRDRRLQAALPPAGFEDVRDGAGAEGVALEGAVDGGAEFLRAVVVEQGEQARGVDAERFAARGQALEQRGDRRDRQAQPVARTRRIGLARGRDEAGDMRLLLDRPGRCRSCARGARSRRCRRSRARWWHSRAASAGAARACAESSSCCGRSARTASCRTITVRITSVSKGCAGSGKSRGCSSARTSATVRSRCSGCGR